MLSESASASCSVTDEQSGLLEDFFCSKHSAERFTKVRQSNPHETDKKEMGLTLFYR